jgi:hypothetical protein
MVTGPFKALSAVMAQQFQPVLRSQGVGGTAAEEVHVAQDNNASFLINGTVSVIESLCQGSERALCPQRRHASMMKLDKFTVWL